MAADGEGEPNRPGSWLGRAFSRIGQWLNRPSRAGDGSISVRFCKYFVLIACVILTLKIVFDAYSFYVARRDIDSELRSKKVSSLEYLGVLSQRKRALAITALEGRCLERTELTLFRIFDAEQDHIKAVYNKLMTIKNQMVDLVKGSGAGLIDVEPAASFINYQRFTLAELEDHVKPINPETANNADYKALLAKLLKLREQYVALALESTPFREQLETMIADKKLDASPYWRMDAIHRVAQRNLQVRKELDDTKSKVGDIEDILARYGVWTGALTGGAANNPVLDEMAYQIEKADEASLDQPNCAAFKDYYAAVNNRILVLDPLAKKSWQDLTWLQRIESIPNYYRQSLLIYFNQPPAAQTLLVTMVLGALGALTLNVLRMSKVGWWSLQDDPLWGEIVVGPLLGALAAFGIFLIGSSGLLLTTDSNGAQPLSAYFIGLLGFISGLLYDEAFGRVRRVGAQIFSSKPSEDAVNAKAEDRSLAEALQNNSASLAASLVLKYGIGTRLSLESEFTLLAPSDEAMGRLSLATWTGLNDPKRDVFNKWYDRHHAAKRVAKADVASNNELKVDDGAPYPLALDGTELKINNTRVLIADISWGKGVIHILSEDVS
jgi:uncharacterized surface protein with fasciclin (FAS1) repeats